MKKLRLMKNVAMHVFLSDYIKRWWSLWTVTKALCSVPWLYYSLLLSFLYSSFQSLEKNAESLIQLFYNLIFSWLGILNCTPYLIWSHEVKIYIYIFSIFNLLNRSKLTSLFRKKSNISLLQISKWVALQNTTLWSRS